MNKTIKIVFNDDTSQDAVDQVCDMICMYLASQDITAIQIVGEEDCEDA